MARKDQNKRAIPKAAMPDVAPATAGRAAQGADTTVNPGGEPPLNKMGVTVPAPSPSTQLVDLVMTDDGTVKQVLVRVAAEGEIALVDWVNFTVGEETWTNLGGKMMVTDDEYVMEASKHLEAILGFGVTAHVGSGRNFYHDSWVLGDKWGFVCFGGQRATMLIMISGQGCAHALPGWEVRLHDFLTTKAYRPKLTRIDLAHDDYEGKTISVDWADEQDMLGGFTSASGGMAPTVEHKGAWRRPSGKGRTLTVGLRESGKYCRFYEKGKKEGSKASPWCRAEVEFKSADRFIPFEVLLHPSDYFLAAYPCFHVLADRHNPTRIETIKKTGQIVWSHALEVTKHQFGKYLKVFREFYEDDSKVLDMLVTDAEGVDAWPKRLLDISRSMETVPDSLHWRLPVTVMTEAQFEAHRV